MVVAARAENQAEAGQAEALAIVAEADLIAGPELVAEPDLVAEPGYAEPDPVEDSLAWHQVAGAGE